MSYLDTLYRAFLKYRLDTEADRECVTQRGAIAKADVEKDNVLITRVVCEIEEDWIDAIEEGLVHVEKALAQERQFIRANGEIVPIEKVKRVSRDSVEHLSRHSNLLTKESDGGDLLPEQLYTVERLNDYAVYENRFLYMLLTYLSEFIGMRYTKISDLTNTYHGTAEFDKTVQSRQREIAFTLKLDEKRRDDPIMHEINPCKNILERISMLLKTVNHFMSTPLMGEVAKAAKLKPPITKTNVLKMDKDFKGAVALYDFISSYDKDGYTVKTITKKMMFSELVADEFAEVYALSSFLTYQYGMGIKPLLKSHYDEAERKRKLIAEQKHLDQLQRLKRHVAESGTSPEGYMLLLENQIRKYEGIYSKLDAAESEIKKLGDEILEHKNTIAALNDTITAKNAEIERLEQKYAEDMAALELENEQNLAAARADYERQTAELDAEWQSRFDGIDGKYRAEIEQIRSRDARVLADTESMYLAKIDEITDGYESDIKELSDENKELAAANAEAEQKCRERIDGLIAEQEREKSAMRAEMDKKEQAVLDIREENRLLEDLKRLSDGRLNALRHQYGLMTDADDFTTENAFNEIESQYDAFKRFFKGEWKKTKKKIRDELLRSQRVTKSEPKPKPDDNAPPPENSSAAKRGEDIIVPDVAQSKSTIDLLSSDDTDGGDF